MKFSPKAPSRILGLVMLFAVCSACKPPAEIRRTRLLMGTKVEIMVQGRDEAKLESAVDAGFQEIERLEAGLSRYQERSVISELNRNAGVSPVRVGPEVFALLEKAVEICRASNGAFDITILPVLELWKFDENSPAVPSEDQLQERLRLVGCDKIVLKKDQYLAFLPEPGMAADLGGIAKGYAADRAAQVLREKGVRSGIVNAGGDLRVFGAQGAGMAIGIQDPRRREKVFAKIYLKDSAVATSGDYQRFFIFEGVRYSHIIDPATGRPARGEESVSVISENGIDADAWATALFVLGSDPGLKLLRDRPGMEALFIAESGEFKTSPGLEQKLILIRGDN